MKQRKDVEADGFRWIRDYSYNAYDTINVNAIHNLARTLAQD